METEPLYVIGKPLVTIFHNETNFFSIIRLAITETNGEFDERELIIKGTFPRLDEESLYRFTGKTVQHPSYGLQFQAETFSKQLPSSSEGVVHYLSSDLFPGIGRKTAQSIVDHLGEDAIQLIVANPSLLDGIPNLTSARKETIEQVLQENLGLEQTIIRLTEWGFGPTLAMRIYQQYREQTIEILQENPYQLVHDVEGIGFHRADEVAIQLGIKDDHPARLQAAAYFVVNQEALQNGHVYSEAKEVLVKAKQLLTQSSVEITFKMIGDALGLLVEEGKLIVEQRRLYVPSLFHAEQGFATRLKQISETDLEQRFVQDEVALAIGEVEDLFDVQYGESQVQAIKEAIHSKVMVLTGGPGTGKTTVIRGIVEVFATLHGVSLDPESYKGTGQSFPIVLAAPTGRAAKRMSESTGLPAMTIHRLLGFTGQEVDEETEKEIEGEFIIIDEASMVDQWLAYQLLKAIPKTAQVLFVGDQDQLPSVGPGQVLRDLLAASTIPQVELSTIFRQSKGSTIIELAHAIKQNEWSDHLFEKTADRSFLPTTAENMPQMIEKIISNALEKGQTIHDIQVLAPMYKGPAGIHALNKMIQNLVNPPGPKRKEFTVGDTVYRVGDKVLQLVNQPESNVFNGDIGEVVAIFTAKETVEKKEQIVLSFDAVEVTYERSEANQFTLAYCCSIHKSQGSEFNTVIMPVVRSHRIMLRRNLLYTGITRAQKFLVICGETEAFRQGIQRNDEATRQTTLTERLTETLFASASLEKEEVEEVVREAELTMQNYTTIDPMIGMEGINPQQFQK